MERASLTVDTPVGLGDSPGAGAQPAPQVHHTLVHSVSLDKFDRLVRSLGGDPQEVLMRSGIDPSRIDFSAPCISYRDFITILNRASTMLGCPSFGLELALLQSGAPILPVSLDLAMRNARTLGEAYQYSSDHLESYSPIMDSAIERDAHTGGRFFRFEVLLNGVPHQQQAIEHAMALLHHSVTALSGGAVHSRGVWFKHENVASLATYQGYFRTEVRFQMPATGILLSQDDWFTPLPNRNPHLYEVATSYIESQFPARGQMISRRVRSFILRQLGQEGCTHEQAARVLGMHPRTLQRRLRDEDTTFEKLRDTIRRDVALQYLAQPQIPLIRIAGLLGYSEQSVLTRSCYRWFSTAPHQLRRELQGTGPDRSG